MKAFLFPGQGSQFVGMGSTMYSKEPEARDLFEQANHLLGFQLTDHMFNGTEEDLKDTAISQPAIFLHSVVMARLSTIHPDVVAGHSLGELSAITAAGYLTFEDGLQLVQQRATAMQAACLAHPSTMAAVIGLPDDQVQAVCQSIKEIVSPANYNCPGQIVISGTKEGIKTAAEQLLEAGARKIIPLAVGGGFHSVLMQPAREQFAQALKKINFLGGRCPVYQNVSACSEEDPEQIKANLLQQLTSPVRWTETIQQMIQDGVNEYFECGPGKVLTGLVKRIDRTVTIKPMDE